MAYQPSQPEIQQCIQLLVSAGSGMGDHKTSLQQLEQMKQNPQFFAVCAYVFANAKGQENLVARQAAGLFVKNNIHLETCASSPVVQQVLMSCLADEDDKIRRVTATAISRAVSMGAWPPNVVESVIAGLRGEANGIVGSLTALCDLCEDAVQLLGATGQTVNIIPAVIPFLSTSQHAIVRKKAVHCVSILFEEAGMDSDSVTAKALRPNALSLLQFLMDMFKAPDSDVTTTCYIVRSMNLLLTFWQEIGPRFPEMVPLMCQKCVDPNENVRKEAVEFWSAVLYVPAFAEQTLGLLPQVISVLLDCMVYSQWELDELHSTENDWQVPDKPDEVRPQRYAVRHQAIGDEAEDDDEGEVLQDTLRSNAGLALDRCAEYYGDKILLVVLEQVNTRMNSGEWLKVESAIMAVGAIAEGCYEGMKQYIPAFLGQVLRLCEDENQNFIVKCICLWCIGQYSFYFSETELPESKALCQRAIAIVLKRMESPTKKLQEAATCALAVIASTLIEKELEDYAVPIVQTIAKCVGAYQLKNRYLLFDTIDSVAGHLGTRLAADDCLRPLLDPLLALWGTIGDDSPMLYPYFTCLAGVCAALGDSILQMAPEIFNRAFRVVEFHSQHRAQIRANPQAAQQDAANEDEFLVAALDLLSGLSDAVGGSIATLIQGQPTFMNVLLSNLADTSSSVRSGSLALLGDLSTAAVGLVQQVLPHIAGPMLEGLKEPQVNTAEASNVAWILHDLTANQQEVEGVPCVTSQYIDGYLPFLIRNTKLTVGHGMLNSAQNAALAIGRFILVDPACVSRLPADLSIDKWIDGWWDLMKHIRSSYNGKEPAIRGMLALLMQNPGVCAPFMKNILETACSFNQPSVELATDFAAFLNAMKTGLGAQWAPTLQQFDPLKQPKLRTLYGIN